MMRHMNPANQMVPFQTLGGMYVNTPPLYNRIPSALGAYHMAPNPGMHGYHMAPNPAHMSGAPNAAQKAAIEKIRKLIAYIIHDQTDMANMGPQGQNIIMAMKAKADQLTSSISRAGAQELYDMHANFVASGPPSSPNIRLLGSGMQEARSTLIASRPSSSTETDSSIPVDSASYWEDDGYMYEPQAAPSRQTAPTRGAQPQKGSALLWGGLLLLGVGGIALAMSKSRNR